MDNAVLYASAVNAARQVLELRERVRVCRRAGYKASTKELKRRLVYAENTVRILANKALRENEKAL